MGTKYLYRITIRGRVQGVGFRWNTLREAALHGIAGFVRNLPGGEVYIEAEGSKEQLNAFAEWCRNGPRSAVVRSIDIEEAELKNFQDFTIEH